MDIKNLTNNAGIYKINFPNGKIYIGLSNHIRTRILEHINKDYKEHPELPISKAIYLYGIQDVDVLELISDEKDRKLLQEREKYWIQYYHSTDSNIGYNLSPGGDGASTGWDNIAAKLTKEQLFELYDLLENSKLTLTELGKKFNLNRRSISRINAGEHYHQPNIKYPIREKRLEKYALDNKQDAFYGRENELNNLLYDLQYTMLSYDELQEKYNIKSTTLSQINTGKKYHNDNFIYPLRKRGTSKVRIFSENEMLLIKEKLEDPNWSMTEIGKLIHCDRKTISNINLGIRQPNANWDYPLRKFAMKTGPK